MNQNSNYDSFNLVIKEFTMFFCSVFVYHAYKMSFENAFFSLSFTLKLFHMFLSKSICKIGNFLQNDKFLFHFLGESGVKRKLQNLRGKKRQQNVDISEKSQSFDRIELK